MDDRPQTEKNDRTIVALLSDIRSMYNVGSMFRSADGAGVSHIYLIGHTPAPVDRFGRKRKEIAKTALGAEESVPWSTHDSLGSVIRTLKEDKYQVVVYETGQKNSTPFDSIVYEEKVALVFGNEIDGVSATALSSADTVAEIPLLGTKESLNVSVAFGLAVYAARRSK